MSNRNQLLLARFNEKLVENIWSYVRVIFGLGVFWVMKRKHSGLGLVCLLHYGVFVRLHMRLKKG